MRSEAAGSSPTAALGEMRLGGNGVEAEKGKNRRWNGNWSENGKRYMYWETDYEGEEKLECRFVTWGHMARGWRTARRMRRR